MTILLTVYGIAIVLLALLMVGIVHRLSVMQAGSAPPREPTQPVPDWITAKIDGRRTHHLVVVVDDTCSICHRTVDRVNGLAVEHPELAELVTVVANSDSFPSERIPVLVDQERHRNLHPGWAPAGIVYSAAGMVERVPVGSEESIDHALDRLSTLAAMRN